MKKGLAFAEWEKKARSQVPAASVVVFAGQEVFFLEAGCSILEEEWRERGTRFERQIYWGGEVNPGQVLAHLNTCPMTTEMRLVVVRHFDDSTAKDLKQWIPYCTTPADWNVLLLHVHDPSRIPEGLSKAIEKNAEVVNAARIKPREMTGWVQRGLKSRGKMADDRVSSALALRSGNDLLQLRNEIDKVVLFSGDRKKVTAEDVSAVGAMQSDASVFALGDAVANGDLAKSTALAREILMGGDAVQSLLGSLAWHTRRLAVAREILDKGGPAQEIASATGVPPYFLDKLIEQTRRTTDHEIRRRLLVIGEWDYRLKRSLIPDSVSPELLIAEILGQTESSPHSR